MARKGRVVHVPGCLQEARYIIKRPPDPIFIATTMPHSERTVTVPLRYA